MIESHASEHLPKTSELFDLADMASGLVAFISNRTMRFESDRGAATLQLLCVNWCPDTIYLHAVRRELQYVHGFDRQFLLLAAHVFVRCHAAVAMRGRIRPAMLLLATRIFVRCHAADAIRGWIRPAIFAAGCTNICTPSCGSGSLYQVRMTSNKQKPVVATCNTVRIIKYFSTHKRIPRRK